MVYRLLSGLPLAAATLLSVFYLPVWVFLPVLLLVAMLAQREFYHLLDRAGIPSFRVIGIMFGVLLISATYFGCMSFNFWPAVDIATAGGYIDEFIIFLLIFVIGIRMFPQRDNHAPLATIACTIFGVLYVAFLFNYFTKIIFTWQVSGYDRPLDPAGRFLVIFLLAVVKMSDTGALLFGKLFGRHKMIPRISPGKTWEGTIGGIVIGTLSGLLCAYLMHAPDQDGIWRMGGLRFAVSDALTIGFILACVAVLGDLVESLLKRAAGVKDSGNLFPGIGGMMDLVDSILLSAPVLYYYVMFMGYPCEKIL